MTRLIAAEEGDKYKAIFKKARKGWKISFLCLIKKWIDTKIPSRGPLVFRQRGVGKERGDLLSCRRHIGKREDPGDKIGTAKVM